MITGILHVLHCLVIIVITLAYEEQVRRDNGDYTRVHLFDENGDSVVTFRDRIISALLKAQEKEVAVNYMKRGVDVLVGRELQFGE